MALFPLSAYLFTIGGLHGRWRPTVVSGARDFLGLAVGLSGVIVFGPIGGFILNLLFPRPSIPAWLALASGYGLVVMLGLPWSRKRLLVYGTDRSTLEPALERALSQLVGSVARTVRGFDAATQRVGVNIDDHEWGRMIVLDVHGVGADALADRLRPVLARELDDIRTPPRRIATLFMFLGAVAVAVPLTLAVLTRS